jgi:NAD(P)-dependent dehydrogenase (short-subunit alcohol dehydrogenase family)
MGNHDNSCDRPSSVAHHRRDVETLAGHGRLDVLVNGAGRTQVGALEETTEAEMRYLFDFHYFGPAALTKAALQHMRSRTLDE